jgi:hypothetical protein
MAFLPYWLGFSSQISGGISLLQELDRRQPPSVEV